MVILPSPSAVAAEAPRTVGTQTRDMRPSQRLQGGLPGGRGISAETRRKGDGRVFLAGERACAKASTGERAPTTFAEPSTHFSRVPERECSGER